MGARGGRYVAVKPHQAIEVLCDDGLWHPGTLEHWCRGADGWEILISWYAEWGHLYSMWFVYSAAAISVPDAECDMPVTGPRRLGRDRPSRQAR